MLYREIADGLVVVSQPTHAWVSGQLARAWGNAVFGAVEPRDDVGLGAEQHDLGWAGWEQSPTRHPKTGRPHRFFEMPTAEHVAIWRGASRRALTQGRYAALLVSLHLTGLYERHDYSADSPDEAAAARELVAEEREVQNELLASLRADPRYASFTTTEIVRRNRRLVAIWDRLSLLLCGGAAAPQTLDGVPTANGETTLRLAPVEGEAEHFGLTPWPFRDARVTIGFDARCLATSPFSDDAQLHEALAHAPWLSIEIQLAANMSSAP
jgi:hypothetical protein